MYMYRNFLPSEPRAGQVMGTINVLMQQISTAENSVRANRHDVNSYLIALVKAIHDKIRQYKQDTSNHRVLRTLTERLAALQGALAGPDTGGSKLYWRQQSQTPGGQPSRSDYILENNNIGFLVTGGGNHYDIFKQDRFYWSLPERTVPLTVGMTIGVIEKTTGDDGHVIHTMMRGVYCVTKVSTRTRHPNGTGEFIVDSNGTVLYFAKMKRLYYNDTFHTENLS